MALEYVIIGFDLQYFLLHTRKCFCLCSKSRCGRLVRRELDILMVGYRTPSQLNVKDRRVLSFWLTALWAFCAISPILLSPFTPLEATHRRLGQQWLSVLALEAASFTWNLSSFISQLQDLREGSLSMVSFGKWSNSTDLQGWDDYVNNSIHVTCLADCLTCRVSCYHQVKKDLCFGIVF